MLTLFFSYSHRDETLRNELEIHLALLKRQGIIETWHDRRISAGKEFEGEISQNLENANIILILVSPYFLASNYCYDVEMRRALDKHNNGEARVVPVILNSCDWHNAPFGKLLVLPKDGKPISKYPNQHDAFLEIVEAVRLIAEEIQPNKNLEEVKKSISSSPKNTKITKEIRSSNLRITKKFSDKAKDDFLDESFDYIAKFFDNSLRELANRNSNIETSFKRVDSNHFSSIIYVNGIKKSQCRIWRSYESLGSNGIAYSNNASDFNGGNLIAFINQVHKYI